MFHLWLFVAVPTAPPSFQGQSIKYLHFISKGGSAAKILHSIFKGGSAAKILETERTDNPQSILATVNRLSMDSEHSEILT